MRILPKRDHFKTLDDEERYQGARNHCVNLVRHAKMTYYKACIDCNKGVSKKLWQNLRDLVPKENKTLPSNLKVGNKIVTDPTEISECFNTFFSHR